MTSTKRPRHWILSLKNRRASQLPAARAPTLGDEASDESDASTLEGTSTSLTLAARDSQTPVFELDFGGKVAERSAGGVKGSWAGGCGNVAACNQDCNAIVLDCPQTNSEQTCDRRLENCARRCAEMSKCNVIDL